MRIIMLFQILFIFETNCDEFPKILWTYWQTGVQPDSLVQLFDNHHKLKAVGYEVRMLNRTTVIPYLDAIPYYQKDIDNFQISMVQHRADYIRVLLLSYYGGVWIDQSTIFTQDLSWLLTSNLKQNPDVVNKYGDSLDVLMFTFPEYGSKKIYYHQKLNQTFEISPGYEMWFMAAKPNSTFMKVFLQQIHKGLLGNMFSQQGYYYIYQIVSKQNIEIGQLNPNLNNLQIIQIIIQRKQQQLDKYTQQSNKTQRELSVWYYKIWHIKSQKGPFAVLNKWPVQQTDVLAKYDIQLLKNIYNINFRYFVKLIGSDRDIFVRYFQKVQRGQTVKQTIQKLKNLDINMVEKYFCPEMYNIYRGSFFYHYLINQHNNDRFKNELRGHQFSPFIQPCRQLRDFVSQIRINNYTLATPEMINNNKIPSQEKLRELEQKTKQQEARLTKIAETQEKISKQRMELAKKRKEIDKINTQTELKQIQENPKSDQLIFYFLGVIASILFITVLFLSIKVYILSKKLKNSEEFIRLRQENYKQTQQEFNPAQKI